MYSIDGRAQTDVLCSVQEEQSVIHTHTAATLCSLRMEGLSSTPLDIVALNTTLLDA